MKLSKKHAKLKTYTTLFCKISHLINKIFTLAYIHSVYFEMIQIYMYTCITWEIEFIYLFIVLNVITEVTKHFKNMLQQALGPKVFRLLYI